ncbi:MAG: DinB family protein [Chloroflexota bacterium]
MTAHQLVLQLKFARQKWLLGHAGLTNEDASQRLGEANSISWMVGHLAWFEQLTWVEISQGKTVTDTVHAFSWNHGSSVPALDAVLANWHQITAVADDFLNQVTEETLSDMLYWGERPMENVGTMLRRQIWHYWYHLGEMQAIRQLLGHQNLPPYIGQMTEAVIFTS